MPQRHCLACEITLLDLVCDWCGGPTLEGEYPYVERIGGFRYDGPYAQTYPKFDPREIA